MSSVSAQSSPPSTNPPASSAVPGAAALAKGIAVLNAIGASSQPQRFGELAAATGLPKGTLHRLLAALIAERLVRLEPREQTYRLGLRVLELAQRVWEDFDVRTAAEPELARLRELTGETVHLAILDDGAVVYIDKLESPQRIRMYSAVGKRGPVHCTGVGKAMLAFLEPGERSALLSSRPLARFNGATLTNPDQLESHLELIRRRGYATDEGEHEAGIHCVAAPILDHHGRPIAGLSVTGPSFRLSLARIHELGPAVVAAARAVSELAGARH